MKHVHIMAIGGSGASAIAAIAKAQGFKVTGCDKNPFNDFTKEFDQATLFTGHSEEHLKDVDILCYSPAISSLDPDNPELKKAKENGIEVLTWQEFMGKYLEKDKFVIAITGTKGKTTTTAMSGLVLEEANLDPTVELGAIVKKWGRNHRVGSSKYFVTEADEFNNNFLVSHPDIAIVTNIVFDHPEFFKDFEEYKDAFFNFLCQVKEIILANLSDPIVAEICKYVMKETGVQVIDYSKSDFQLDLKVPGEFNKLNANAAFHLGLLLQISPEVIKSSLESYESVSRRFEKIGEFNHSLIYSDYAHNPLSLEVTMRTIKEIFPDKKSIIIFEPHMFSRTKALFSEFVDVLKNSPSDLIYITDIFPSRELDTGLVNSKQLVEAINKENVKYISKGDLKSNLIKDDAVVFFMGAGEIDKVARTLIESN